MITRLHSSRMRTTHALTVSPSMLLPGVGYAPGGPGCLLWGGGSVQGGVCSWGGVCSQGGVCRGGVCSGGCLLPGEYPSMHWGRPPPLLTESQMPVKTLPCPNFVAGGKYSEGSKKLNFFGNRNRMRRWGRTRALESIELKWTVLSLCRVNNGSAAPNISCLHKVKV